MRKQRHLEVVKLPSVLWTEGEGATVALEPEPLPTMHPFLGEVGKPRPEQGGLDRELGETTLKH